MKALAERTWEYHVKIGGMKEEDHDLYVYAYLLLAGQVFNLAIAMIIGIISGDLVGVVLFLFVFIPLRHYAGGYHANTPELCVLQSAIVLFTAIYLYKVVLPGDNCWRSAGAGLTASVIIWFMSPVAASAKPLSSIEHMKYKRIARKILLVDILLAVVFILARRDHVAVLIWISLSSVAVLQILGLKQKTSF